MENQAKFPVNIRPVTDEDVPVLHELINAEGWRNSIEHVNFFRQMSPDLYYAAEDSNGHLISFCCVQRLGEDEATLDYYVTRPEYRRRGIGTQVYEACMAALGDRRFNLSLFTVLKNIPMYSKMGFSISYELRSISGEVDHEKVSVLVKENQPEMQIVPTSEVSQDDIISFDGTICKIPRQDLIKGWLQRPHMKTFVALKKSCIVGYICMCPAEIGYQLMPFYARSSIAARLLWKTACENIPKDTFLKIYPPNINTDAASLFENTLKNRGPTYDVVHMTNKMHNAQHKISDVYSILAYVGTPI